MVFSILCRARRGRRSDACLRYGIHRNFDIGAGPGKTPCHQRQCRQSLPLVAGAVGPRRHGRRRRSQCGGRKARSIGRPPAGTPMTATGAVVTCALAAISETDMMLLGVRDYGPGRAADPRTAAGRSALYSLAFMLRRAAAVYLDIQDYELKAGIRSHEDRPPRIGRRPDIPVRHARKWRRIRDLSRHPAHDQRELLQMIVSDSPASSMTG